ncbi:hypothetical protein ACROYT_G011819 [Oculina patagonica]
MSDKIIPQVECADLGNVDYIAIAVSLGLTAFLVSIMGCFLWRARNRSAMDTNNVMGQNNLAVTANNDGVYGVSLAPLPPAYQEQSIITIDA